MGAEVDADAESGVNLVMLLEDAGGEVAGDTVVVGSVCDDAYE